MTDDERVIVESATGPQFGYYHNKENGTAFGAKEMSREEAEYLGYSRCRSCFPEDDDAE